MVVLSADRGGGKRNWDRDWTIDWLGGGYLPIGHSDEHSSELDGPSFYCDHNFRQWHCCRGHIDSLEGNRNTDGRDYARSDEFGAVDVVGFDNSDCERRARILWSGDWGRAGDCDSDGGVCRTSRSRFADGHERYIEFDCDQARKPDYRFGLIETVHGNGDVQRWINGEPDRAGSVDFVGYRGCDYQQFGGDFDYWHRNDGD